MISKTLTRKTLKSVIKALKIKGIYIDYPMAEFRHAIFACVERCKLIQFCSWRIDTDKKLTICNLFFSAKKIECKYSYEENMIDVNVYKTINETEQFISTSKIACSELADFIYAQQPKAKIMIKRA